MKKKKKKAKRQPIEAAGGIVMRGRIRPLFAVVQLRRQKDWVLPKGKLARDETAVQAARREVIEETGHDVEVHEFVGQLAYKAGGRPKIVRFWRMQASPRPIAKLMHDVRAVRWLPLSQAIGQLTHDREKRFLDEIGHRIVRQTGPGQRRAPKRPGRPLVSGGKKTVPTRTPVGAGAHLQPPSLGAAPPQFAIQLVGRKPPAVIRKVWALLRR
jgi:8-oxo-dGTP diphosphatase